jgi:hypothetical protein
MKCIAHNNLANLSYLIYEEQRKLDVNVSIIFDLWGRRRMLYLIYDLWNILHYIIYNI